MSDRLPETHAAERIGEIIGRYQDPAWLTPECLKYVGSKVVANRAAIRQVLSELDAHPNRLPDRDVVLARQQYAQVDDLSYWLEHRGHLQRECDDVDRIIARIEAGHSDRFSPDDRAADEDTARISAERASERAIEHAPRGIAS